MLDSDFICQLLNENTDLRTQNIKLEEENMKLRELLQALQEECLVKSLRRKIYED